MPEYACWILVELKILEKVWENVRSRASHQPQFAFGRTEGAERTAMNICAVIESLATVWLLAVMMGRVSARTHAISRVSVLSRLRTG